MNLAKHKLPFVGFTVLEALIALAMLAIMIAAISPVAFQQIEHHRKLTTRAELEEIQRGLMKYRRDLGDFPSEKQGLAALVVNTGSEDWQGPYMPVLGRQSRDTRRAVTTDAFGVQYIYDPNPSTLPRGVVDVLVLSCGTNRRRDLGQNGPLLLAKVAEHDDLIVTVSTNFMALAPPRPSLPDRSRAQIQMAGLGFDPASFASQSGKTGSAKAGSPTRNFLRPELSIELRTRLTLDYLQSLLNADPDLLICSVWNGDNGMRNRLNLGIEFEQDGWGRQYYIEAITRRIFSAGSDGNPWTNGDNLPEGVGFW